jgi:AcrR family transcriptional regulator
MRPSPRQPAETVALPGSGVQRRTQVDRRAESDRRILAAARRLIAEKGSNGTSLAEIGLAAGYSRGLPSERFGTKQRLIDALLDEVDRGFARELPDDLAQRRGLAGVAARIEAHLQGAMRSPEAVRLLYVLYMESLTAAPQLHPRIAGLARSYRDGFAYHLREARRDGEIARDVAVEEQATVVLGALRGLIMQWLIEPDAIDLDASGKALVAMLQHSLGDSCRKAATPRKRN